MLINYNTGSAFEIAPSAIIGGRMCTAERNIGGAKSSGARNALRL